MGNLRPALAIGLVFLAYMLWVEWQKDYGPQPTPAEPASVSDTRGQSIPSIPEQAAEDLPTPAEPGSAGRQMQEEGVPAIEAPAVMTPACSLTRPRPTTPASTILNGWSMNWPKAQRKFAYP